MTLVNGKEWDVEAEEESTPNVLFSSFTSETVCKSQVDSKFREESASGWLHVSSEL